jgi:hypothetical protein
MNSTPLRLATAALAALGLAACTASPTSPGEPESAPTTTLPKPKWSGAGCEIWISPGREAEVGVVYRTIADVPGTFEMGITALSGYSAGGVRLPVDDMVKLECEVGTAGDPSSASCRIKGVALPGVASASSLGDVLTVFASDVEPDTHHFTLEVHFGDVRFAVPFKHL